MNHRISFSDYFIPAFLALCGVALLVIGGIQFWFAYQDHQQAERTWEQWRRDNCHTQVVNGSQSEYCDVANVSVAP